MFKNILSLFNKNSNHNNSNHNNISTEPRDIFSVDEIVNDEVASRKLEEMENAMDTLCEDIFSRHLTFNEEECLIKICEYITNYNRLLYATISHYVFDHPNEESIEFNIRKMLEFVYSDRFSNFKSDKEAAYDKVIIDKSKTVVVKIKDHVDLAMRQMVNLKEDDETFARRFKENSSEITKDMSNQLITLVAIFTAMAFVVFGGISSLDNITKLFLTGESLINIIILCVVWSWSMINLVFVFLFCVSKITKFSFESDRRPKANLIQRYPIIFWSNLLMGFALSILLWFSFLINHGYQIFLIKFLNSHPIAYPVIGFVVICVLFLVP